MDLKGITKEYSNDKITVYWKPAICQHAGRCVAGSPAFNTAARPWVDLTKDSAEHIMQVIDTCPSGALTYKRNNK